MDLESYRSSAEGFVTELTAEYYRHYAGLKESFEIEPIYDAHAELFTVAAVEGLRDGVWAAAPDGDGRRQLAMLLDFALEGHIGQLNKRAEAELARREASITLHIGQGRLGFRESSVVQANEADRERREEIEQARLNAIAAELNPLYAEIIDGQQAVARELGYGSYRQLCAEAKEIDLGALHSQTSLFSAQTEASYGRVVEPELRATLGVGLDDLRRSDLSRFFRAPSFDDQFPASALIDSFRSTMNGLGFSLSEQPGVVLDVEPRPSKSPRAFCAPVRVPQEVYLVLTPLGGRDDYNVLFHEGGHTEHYANVDPDLPFEFRQLGDNAITESYAFLVQHLVADPEWLARRLGIDDSEQIAAHARAERLVYLRRYAAKLAYELELHDRHESLDGLPARYAYLLSSGLQIDWPSQTFLSDVDPGFYCTCYLRAWAVEAQLREHLRERFGPAWFDSREAGSLLRGVWRQGQRQTPEELLQGLTGRSLDFAALTADLGLDETPGYT